MFVSEDVRDELDAVVRRLGGRGMSVSGLLENLAREHLAAYRVGTSSSGEKSDSLLPGRGVYRCMHCSLYTRFNVENAGGDFSVGGARVCFRIPENPCSPAPGGCWEGKSAPAGRRFWNERSTDEKEKNI
nr:DUF3408 domain-containing protein [Parabacteroides johnsonii]